MTRTRTVGLGRASRRLAGELRKSILAGELVGGDFLPTVRDLCAEYKMAPDTVCRGLRSLESEGLVAAEPRQGYRVLARAGDPEKGSPVAYVLSAGSDVAEWDPFHQMLQGAFQRAAAERGWTLLGVNSGGLPASQVVEQLRTARVFGAIMDTMNRELLSLVDKAGMPAVMVDVWEEHTGLDAVIQDNYRGAYLAAEWLAQRGHQRVAWFGPVKASSLSRERFGGACAALAACGARLPMEVPIEMGDSRHEVEALEMARRFMDMPDRPKAVLALWTPLALGIAQAAREKGLVIGRDIDLVGWAAGPTYAERYVPAFEGEYLPPCVVWSVDEVARTTMARLGERRANPKLPALRISVPATLKVSEKGE